MAELEDRVLPSEITSRLLTSEGACPPQTVEEFLDILELIFIYRASVGLEIQPSLQQQAFEQSKCEGLDAD